VFERLPATSTAFFLQWSEFFLAAVSLEKSGEKVYFTTLTSTEWLCVDRKSAHEPDLISDQIHLKQNLVDLTLPHRNIERGFIHLPFIRQALERPK
jgi:hypothetical protein